MRAIRQCDVLSACGIERSTRERAHRDTSQPITISGSSNASFAAIIVAPICSTSFIDAPHLTVTEMGDGDDGGPYDDGQASVMAVNATGAIKKVGRTYMMPTLLERGLAQARCHHANTRIRGPVGCEIATPHSRPTGAIYVEATAFS